MQFGGKRKTDNLERKPAASLQVDARGFRKVDPRSPIRVNPYVQKDDERLYF